MQLPNTHLVAFALVQDNYETKSFYYCYFHVTEEQIGQSSLHEASSLSVMQKFLHRWNIWVISYTRHTTSSPHHLYVLHFPRHLVKECGSQHTHSRDTAKPNSTHFQENPACDATQAVTQTRKRLVEARRGALPPFPLNDNVDSGVLWEPYWSQI